MITLLYILALFISAGFWAIPLKLIAWLLGYALSWKIALAIGLILTVIKSVLS